eukprot:CAMPEP_0167755188 /NCGR_PEP_ID=MMETSP0110_2-20121227/8682_1 /TAXON_ID=629695 /ORGANISM="Gymnochlora sp., Strain CCMP2014" /LENGTH=151 /DNA_ID=CAMNT_0007641141 /DNA_START=247 /DNA_END=702 /DNA_ORIENTATION=+
MVIKTDLCYFTECKVFPGHGIRYVRKDSKLLTFLNRKAFSLHLQRKKAQRLRWTLVWRRKHKATASKKVKKKAKKTVKVVRAIAGLSLDELKKRRDAKPATKKPTKASTIKAVKKRKVEKKDRKKKKDFAKRRTGFVKVPKTRMKMRSTQR